MNHLQQNMIGRNQYNEIIKYFGDKKIESYGYQNYVQNARRKGEAYGPPLARDMKQWYENPILDQVVIDNLIATGRGEYGTPFERSMWQFYKNNPLHDAVNKDVLSGDLYAKFLMLFAIWVFFAFLFEIGY